MILNQLKILDKNYFDLNSIGTNKLVATKKLLYPKERRWLFGFNHSHGTPQTQTVLGEIHKKNIKSALQSLELMRSPLNKKKIQRHVESFSDLKTKDFFKNIKSSPRNSWPPAQTPGLYRHEHASVIISSETTQLIVDPAFLSAVAPPLSSSIQPSLNQKMHGILITHSHFDHWNLPSLYFLTKENTCPIFVPEVPKESILCCNFKKQLQRIGLCHTTAKWGETIKIGDIEVDVLPFYGEQPNQEVSWANPDIRNWGNCYRVNTPHFSVLIMADSGSDPYGNMIEVVTESNRKRGPCDVVLACMRDFLTPMEVLGLETYWTVFTFEQLKEMFKIYKAGNLKSTTAGTDGLGKICRAAEASYFLPYAQGFDGMGQKIGPSNWGASAHLSEKNVLKKLKIQFEKLKMTTKIHNWNPGDQVYFKKNKLIEIPFKDA